MFNNSGVEMVNDVNVRNWEVSNRMKKHISVNVSFILWTIDFQCL